MKTKFFRFGKFYRCRYNRYMARSPYYLMGELHADRYSLHCGDLSSATPIGEFIGSMNIYRCIYDALSDLDTSHWRLIVVNTRLKVISIFIILMLILAIPASAAFQFPASKSNRPDFSSIFSHPERITPSDLFLSHYFSSGKHKFFVPKSEYRNTPLFNSSSRRTN